VQIAEEKAPYLKGLLRFIGLCRIKYWWRRRAFNRLPNPSIFRECFLRYYDIPLQDTPKILDAIRPLLML
jgi:hypothetical protein